MLLGLLNHEAYSCFLPMHGEAEKAGSTGEGVKQMCRHAVKRQEAQKKHGSSFLFNLGFRIFLKLDCVPALGFPKMSPILK